MASHFKSLSEAKSEFKKRTGQVFKDQRHYDGTTIFNRNKGRKKKKLKPLTKPYFVGSYLEWVNL